jgi:hypothetical protein
LIILSWPRIALCAFRLIGGVLGVLNIGFMV